MTLFKAYDLRGKVPEELNTDIAYEIGCVFAKLYTLKKIAVGYDIRNESPALMTALIKGLTDYGCDVFNIGLCGTEEVYFATFYHQLDGGIMVTASHNPKSYNGMKLVSKDARPISADNGLFDIRDQVEARLRSQDNRSKISDAANKAHELRSLDKRPYIEHLLSYIDIKKLKPLKVLANPGNGGAGDIVKLLSKHLPFDIVSIHSKADGDFPNGVPNPLLLENQDVTTKAVLESQADLGLAWDGDFDRCFFFDKHGRFIDSYYLVGLLAKTMLEKEANAAIVHDPRLNWNTIEETNKAGGRTVTSKSGHAFMKQVMRENDAIYGGEMSAHHYFRSFSYCDSGMIPWLLITELMSTTGKTLHELVDDCIEAYPCCGEINFKVNDCQPCIDGILDKYKPQALLVDFTDGISLEFSDWRFNLRASNTEPLLRLNIESRANPNLVKQKLAEMSSIIEHISSVSLPN